MVDLSAVKVSCGRCSLQDLCLPRGLTTGDLEALDNYLERPKPLGSGEYLFREGETAKYLYAVRSGSFKTLTDTSNGDEQVFGFHLAGELLGMDALEKDIHTCSAVALENASVCGIPLAKLEELCNKIQSLQRHIIGLVGREITADHSLLLLLGKASAEERVASFLWSLSRRFHDRGFSATEFNLGMSRHDIGNFLGLAVETISRVLAHFQEKGIIKVDRRRITINDIDGLKEIVDHCSSGMDVPGNNNSAPGAISSDNN